MTDAKARWCVAFAVAPACLVVACSTPVSGALDAAADDAPAIVDAAGVADASTVAGDAGVTTDAAVPSDAFPGDGWVAPPQTCAEATGPSGYYTIDPDGSGLRAPYRVWCDMDTDGGGWTVIFVAAGSNLNSLSLDYDVDDATLRMRAGTQVLMGARDDVMSMLPGWSRFAIPPAWQTMSPFRYQYYDTSVDAVLWNGTAITTNLKFGWAQWSTFDPGSWVTTGASEGAIALTGTGATLFTEFATDREDYCATSADWMAIPCSPTRRFSIAVRAR